MGWKFALVFCLVSIVFADDDIKPKENEVLQKVEETNVTDSVTNETGIDSRRSAARMAIVKPAQELSVDIEYCRSTDIILKVLDFVLKLYFSDQGQTSQLIGLQNVLMFLKRYVTRLPRNPNTYDLINNYDKFLNIINYRLPYSNNNQEGLDSEPIWRPTDNDLENSNINNIFTYPTVPGIINNRCKEALYQVIKAAKKAYIKLLNNPECQAQGPLTLPDRPFQYDNSGTNELPYIFPNSISSQNDQPGFVSFINAQHNIELGNQVRPSQGDLLKKIYSLDSYTPIGFENLSHKFDGANPNLYQPSKSPDVTDDFLHQSKFVQSNDGPLASHNMLWQQSKPFFALNSQNLYGSAKPEPTVKLPESNEAADNTFGNTLKDGYKQNNNKNLLHTIKNIVAKKRLHANQNLPPNGFNLFVDPTKVKKNPNSNNRQQHIQAFVNNGNGAGISYLETMFDPTYRPLLGSVQQPNPNLGGHPSAEILKNQPKELVNLNPNNINELGSPNSYSNGMQLLQNVNPYDKSFTSVTGNLKPNLLTNPDADQNLLYANTPYSSSNAYVLNQPNGNRYADGLPYQYNLGVANPNNNEDFGSFPQQDPSQLAGDNSAKLGELGDVENPNQLKQAANPGVIVLTYLVKQPNALKYQPYYYVKYRLPYSQFLKTIKNAGKSSELRSGVSGLREYLILNSSIADVSPDLKHIPKTNLSSLVLNTGELVGAYLIDKNEKVINLARSDSELVESNKHASLSETISDENKKLIEMLTANIDPKKVLELNKNISQHSNDDRFSVKRSRYEEDNAGLAQSAYGEFYAIKNRNKLLSQLRPQFNSKYGQQSEVYKSVNFGQQPSSEYDNDNDLQLSVIPLHPNQKHDHYGNRNTRKRSFFRSSFVNDNAGLIPAILTGKNEKYPGYYRPVV